MNKVEFGIWVRSKREDKGWSQADLARESGLYRSIINNIENGVSNSSPTTLNALAKALGQPPEDLRPQHPESHSQRLHQQSHRKPHQPAHLWRHRHPQPPRTRKRRKPRPNYCAYANSPHGGTYPKTQYSIRSQGQRKRAPKKSLIN